MAKKSKFEMVKNFYDNGLWKEKRVRDAVAKGWIGPENFKEITGRTTMNRRTKEMMKDGICTAIGVVGSVIASLFGGWDAALVTLVIFMAIDLCDRSALWQVCSIIPVRQKTVLWSPEQVGRDCAVSALLF